MTLNFVSPAGAALRRDLSRDDVVGGRPASLLALGEAPARSLPTGARRGRGVKPLLQGALLAISILAPIASEAAEGRRNKADANAVRSAPAAAPAAPASPANSFEPFALIAERNIFNPNRTGRTRTTPEEKPPRVDEITLVGTMEYAKGRVAFFESTDAAFRKTVKEGDAVADFTVKRIAAEGVDLTRGEAVTALRVAQQLRRPEGGEWTVTAAPVETGRRDGGAGAAGADRGKDSAGAPAIPADASEVLKRLMRQREKQLK